MEGRCVMAKIIYKIEILGWDKHNKKSRKNMPSIMLSKRFFDDVKIQMLSSSGKLLYLFLLLRRGDVDTNSFECLHDHCVTAAGGRGVLVSTLLDQMQSFQLLIYEIITPNRIEKNRIESKRKEKKPKGEKATENADRVLLPPLEKVEKNTSHLIAHYCDKWKLAYRVTENPIITGKDSRALKLFFEQVGFEKAERIITAYLRMGDKWFVTKRHDIQTMLSSTNAIIQFIDTGKIITQSELSGLDKNQTNQNTLDALRNGEI